MLYKALPVIRPGLPHDDCVLYKAPAVIRTGPCHVAEEVAVGPVPFSNLLHRDHLLVLDVEDEVAVALLLLDVIVLELDLLRDLYSARHSVSDCGGRSTRAWREGRPGRANRKLTQSLPSLFHTEGGERGLGGQLIHRLRILFLS